MGITIHYHASVCDEQRVEDMARHFDKAEYNPRKVNFELTPRWIRTGYLFQPDYEENWGKYSLGSWADVTKKRHGGILPTRYKGIILGIDEGCELLWFAFGLYPDTWHCRNFSKTQFAKNGFATHVKAISLLDELKEYVDKLEVHDEAGFWDTRDIEYAAKAFNHNEAMIKSLGELLKDMASQYGLTVQSGYELSGKEKRVKDNEKRDYFR